MNSKLIFAAISVALFASACPLDGDGDIINGPTAFVACTASEECPTGNVCNAGLCVLGSCDPFIESACDVGDVEGPYCCKPWELCSTLSFTCEDDPNVDGIGCDPNDPTCTLCEEQRDCAGGQFCSGATCLLAAGRDGCTSSFQCTAGERCDRNVFLCVPDRGACQFCDDFEELCCEDGQVCSDQTGFCTDIPDAECQEDSECNAGLFCDELGRCVQCDANHACGPGLLCDSGEGDCFHDDTCLVDNDCNGNERCPPGTLRCIIAECQSDSECFEDDRHVCNLDTFKCELPDPICPNDVDEDNDTPELASPLVGGVSFSGYLCRGDTDVLSFPVIADKRYTATVNFAGSGQPGILVTMLGTDGSTIESTSSFGQTQSFVEVAGVTAAAETGTFYLKIQMGNTDDRDFRTFTVTVAEDEPSQLADCSAQGQLEEPNNSFETATELVLGATRTFSRCGTGDVDFYHVTVPALSGVQATIASFFNAEGNINVELFKAPNALTGSRVDSGTNVNPIEIVDAPEVSLDFWLKVSLASPSGAVTNQTYSVNTVAVARPAACLPDPTEDDGSAATAVLLTLSAGATPSVVATDLVRCNPQDKDFFRFSMPPNLGGVVLLRFTHSEGDMALDLFRADDVDGPTLDTSNVSNAASDPDEQVEVPGSATDTIDYIAVARLNGASGGTTGQKYTLEVQTFDNGQCIASEPSGGDDIFANGRCVGEFTELAPPNLQCTNDGARIAEPMITADLDACAAAADGTIPGCGRMCGNGDSDWYRVGTLNNDQILHAVLDYDPLGGELGLARGTLTASSGAVAETSSTDTDHDGHLELSFAAPRNAPKEYGVRVKPVGATGHQVQRYSLKIEVGAECPEDALDVGALLNEKPLNATDIRSGFDQNTPLDFTSTALTRCTNDVDVFRLAAFAGETITVELVQVDSSPGGLIVELGSEPVNLNDPAVLVASAVAGAAPITLENATGRLLFVTVKAPAGVVVTGPYTLHVTAD